MLHRRARLLRRVGGVLVLFAMAACGGDEEPSSAPDDCTPIRDGRITLVAENLAWNTDCLVVPARTDVTFRVDLRDRSVDHNLALSGPSLAETVKTPLERGPKVQTLKASFGTAGFNEFVCDIHPSMEGDLFVE